MSEKIMDNVKKLNKELYLIECKNWVISQGRGTSAAGQTLELLLNKKLDSIPLADKYGIEIKSRSLHSDYPLHLFCATFDNRPLEIQRLFDIGAYTCKNDSDFKAFNTSVSAVCYKTIRWNKYKINVDYNEEKVKLLIYKPSANIPYSEMSWSFYELENRLNHKLKYMVLVSVLRDIKNDNVYFKYIKPKFYKLRGFREFLKLVETGEICVTFKINQFKSGERKGQILDRGTSFDININSLEKLFEEINLDKIN